MFTVSIGKLPKMVALPYYNLELQWKNATFYKNNLTTQHTFRNGYFTAAALTQMTDDWVQSIA